MKKVKTMRDGTTAVLTLSGRYYVRYMWKGKSYNRPLRPWQKWDRVEHYTLTGMYIPLTRAECEHCGEIVQSQYCGHYATCHCGRTSVDTHRYMPEIGRIIKS